MIGGAKGIGLGLDFGIGNPFRKRYSNDYIAPAVKESLVGLWKFDQNTNESPTRNIIKNTIKDKGGDLELLNFGYKLNSGYNGYPEDFTTYTYNAGNVIVKHDELSFNGNANTPTPIIYKFLNGNDSDLKEYTINFTKIGDAKVTYRYIDINGNLQELELIEGKNKLPYSYVSKLPIDNTTIWIGYKISKGNGCTITQLPLYEGALVTDGKDDMIVSQKTVQEMLGGSKEITVVSMAVNLDSQEMMCNSIFTNTNRYNIRNTLDANKVVSILGYTDNNVNTNNINLIMGDKNSIKIVDRVNYNASYPFYPINYPSFYYKAAVYWTFISNKVLTTDEINQIIGYYKLDKYVTPQVIYDVKRQGLTNDTPNEDWYLKDFSGNGHDMQLYNYAKTPESGINEEGGLQSDGVNDYGKAERLPIFKDYTVVADRALIGDGQGAFMTKSSEIQMGAFGLEIATGEQMSFGNSLHTSIVNKDRSITYMSTYSYNGQPNTKGTREDGSYLCLATIKPGDSRFSSVALWSLLLFPYSLSEFLLERQLKKYKLGTLYPDMVEFRPVISGNIPYENIQISINNDMLYYPALNINKTGIYLEEGSILRIYINSGKINEVSKITINGVEYTDLPINVNGNYYADFPITKSPQKISYVIDEYIRFEDIVQPYPVLLRFKDENGNEVSWGGKLRIGSTVTYIDHFQNNNLLKELYKVSAPWINNRPLATATEVVERQMIYRCTATWIKDGIAPKCILSPSRLRIPNSSYKILGYVPDLTGKGNHGKLNNFAYTEDSGVATDGSIKFDGTEDHITIPTLAHGGKCVMMKVNWSNESGTIYDQRVTDSGEFAIFLSENNLDNEIVPAYGSRNNGNTYIDGILNTSILTSQLKSITHNITIANDKVALENTASPFIGCKSAAIGFFANMSLYEFILFPEIPSEDEIKKLNDVMGIEGGYVESPNYYWDAYGKKNTDTDKNLIADQVSKDIANALKVKNVGYNSESGYNGYIELLFNKWSVFINENRAEIDKTDTTLNITKVYIQNKAIIYCGIGHYLADIPSKYKITGVDDTHPIKFGNDGFPNEPILTVTKDGEYEVDWYNYGKNPCIMAGFIGDCNITIEQVAQYPNGLLLDGVEDHAINTVIPAVTDFTVIAKREFPESALVNNQTFLIKGDAINGNNNINSLLMECYYGAQNYIISFSHQQIVPLEESKISWITPTSYNGNALTKGSGVDSVGLTIGRCRDLYRKAVLYKLMFYTKTIDQLSINMLKNLFERDELIDVTNPIFKKDEL
jgi:hypothetical protein